MKINFYATLREITGKKTIEFDLDDGITVGEMVGVVVERYPEMGPKLLDDNGQLFRYVHVFINGRDAPYLDNALDTILHPEDKIDIFPAVGGG